MLCGYVAIYGVAGSNNYSVNPLNLGEDMISHDTDRNGRIDYSCDMEYPQLSDAGEISDEAYL